MGKIGKILLSFSSLLTGRNAAIARNRLLTPEQFTERFIEALGRGLPDFKHEISRKLIIEVTLADKVPWTFNLQRPYSEYKLCPEAYDEIMGTFVVAQQKLLVDQTPLSGSLEQIVPVVRCRAFVEGIFGLYPDRAEHPSGRPMYHELNEELLVLYAYDSVRILSFLSEEQFAETNLTPDGLFSLAIDNLWRILPKVTTMPIDGGGLLISAGGNFELSLLLFDEMWEDGQLGIDGVPVVAVPARDLLLVAGGNDPVGVANLRKIAFEAPEKYYPLISDKLFVRRNQRWEIFPPDSVTDTNYD